MEYAPEDVCRAAIERHLAGDSTSLGTIAHRIATVLSLAWRWSDAVEVEDAVQEAVRVGLDRARNYDPDKGKAFAYLTQVIKNSFCRSGRDVRLRDERVYIYAERRHREAGGTGRVRRRD